MPPLSGTQRAVHNQVVMSPTQHRRCVLSNTTDHSVLTDKHSALGSQQGPLSVFVRTVGANQVGLRAQCCPTSLKLTPLCSREACEDT